MARNLKSGDTVTVTKTVNFRKTSDTYQAGLTAIQPGAVGQVQGEAGDRALIVDFNGVPARIAKRLLQPLPETKKSVPRGRPKSAGRKTAKAAPAQKPESSPVADSTEGPDAQTYGVQVITILANKLLFTGVIEPDEDTVVELRLGDLPPDLLARIKKLIQAKLALTL